MSSSTSSSSGDKCSENATLTIRLIRSFPHTNWKPFVTHGINLKTCSTEELISHIYSSIPDSKLSVPFKTFKGYDCLKIETHRFGHKTNDPLINTEDDDKLILKKSLSLLNQGVEHETEISFFNLEEYLKYKETKKSTSLNS